MTITLYDNVGAGLSHAQPDADHANGGCVEAAHADAIGRVSQVAQKLLDMGFIIITARFGPAPSITVKATFATQQLDSHYKGQGFDGGYHYRTFCALVDGVQVEWHKPHRAIAVH